MHFIACDAYGRTLCDGLGGQLPNWHRKPARACLGSRLYNETLVSHGAPVVGWLQVRAASDLPTATTNGTGNTGANTTTSSAAPASTSQDAQPSTTSSGIVPAVIGVAIFVVCVFVALRILRAVRLNRLVAAYTAEPAAPRIWEVRLGNAPGPSFEGKWDEIMPLAAQGFTQCDIISRPTLSRGTSVSADISGNQTSRRDSGDSSRRLLPLPVRKISATIPVDEACGLPGHVAVLISMPAQNKHVSTQGRQAKTMDSICIGIVNV